MCDESELTIEGRAISEMKVVELKEELGKRGLSKIGNKNALHERLKEHLVAELNAKCESESQSTAVESPQRDLTSPPNPLVAEYLAKQQTALREARKDAGRSEVIKFVEAVRRASSGDDGSPMHEKTASTVRRSRRGRRESTASVSTSSVTEEKGTEIIVTSETEQESMEPQLGTNDAESTEDDDTMLSRVSPNKIDDSVDSASVSADVKTPEETERTETEYDDSKLVDVQHSIDSVDIDSYNTNSEDIFEEQEMKDKHDMEEKSEPAVSDAHDSDSDTNESSTKFSAAETVSLEKKRRWKPYEATHFPNSVVTVSIGKQKEEGIEIDEEEDRLDTQTSIDFKEELSDTKDRMEELDYEEPMQSSVAEVAEEVKAAEEVAERHKEKMLERVERHAKRADSSRLHKRSPTPEKQAENQTTMDGFVRERQVSPARYPVNQVIMIRQLTRPYTVKQLQQLLSIFGTIVEGGFWIDNIKSTCIAKYSTVEEAIVARGRLHNVVWPPCSPKTLKIDYSDDANLAKHIAADQSQNEGNSKASAEIKSSEISTPALRVKLSVDEKRRHVQPASQEESGKDSDKKERERREHEVRGRKRSASPIGRTDVKRSRRRRSPWRDEPYSSPVPSELKSGEPEKRVKTADELFLKTKTQPAIYYLPLTEEQIVERIKRKALEAELAKKVSQNGAVSKRKEIDEPVKEKMSAKKAIHVKSSPSHRRSRTPSRRRSRSPVGQRDRRRSKSRSPRRRH
ncbi:unnamed protein product [Thelazia callipaeda]|uniref:SAP domain-containing protein n=1 Tax=Thelazia callipaeda TaxID=103827 RepID=A0A0N5D521_THECL|nr:unnamed protein product [Thelazia callipaeda]